jgi:hypothetical protein
MGKSSRDMLRHKKGKKNKARKNICRGLVLGKYPEKYEICPKHFN